MHHFGNGVAIGSLLPARTHVALFTPDPDHVFADGRAVGVLVTVGVHTATIGLPTDAGLIGITRLAPQEARAEAVLGIGLTVQTAPAL